MNTDFEKTISNYFEHKEGILAVYLFGSYAQGRQKPSSDVDIGIVAERESHDIVERSLADYIVELGRLLRKDIHPVILNTAGEELLRQVFSRGKCILVKDPRKLAEYRMVMFARIVDFAYYKKLMQSGLVKSISREPLAKGSQD